MKKSGKIYEAVKSQRNALAQSEKEFKVLKGLVRNIDESKFPEGTEFWMGTYTVSIRIPWGVENLRAARSAVGAPWSFSDKHEESDGSIVYRYIHFQNTGEMTEWGSERRMYFSLSINMSAIQLDPGTCTRVLVGEEERSYKVQTWKVICADGTEKEESEVMTEISQ